MVDISGLGDAFYSMLKKEGIRGMYKGSMMSVVRAMTGSGANLASFYGLKEYLINNGLASSPLSLSL